MVFSRRVAILVLFFCTFSSCVYRSTPSLPPPVGEAEDKNATNAPAAMAPPAKSAPTHDVYQGPVALNGPHGSTLARVDGTFVCDDPPRFAMTLSVHLRSLFGDASISFTPVNTDASEDDRDVLQVEAEAQRFSYHPDTRAQRKLAAFVCLAAQNGGQTELDDEMLAALDNWAAAAVPDCQTLTRRDGGYDCALPQGDPVTLRHEFLAIQKDMVQRWSRQPYLFARRLAVANSLAMALDVQDDGTRLNAFCEVARHSLVAELPTTLGSPRWQGRACDTSSPHRREAALFGLSKAAAEIQFLRRLFETTSRLGLLNVRLSAPIDPGAHLLVSLEPGPDVMENLERAAAALNTATPAEGSGACWHPLYGETNELMQRARRLSLVGVGLGITCGTEVEAAAGPVARYMAESVTSETEFVVTNGMAKTLRLPAGQYRYSLRALPDDSNTWDDALQQKPEASGAITWDNNHPRPAIETW